MPSQLFFPAGRKTHKIADHRHGHSVDGCNSHRDYIRHNSSQNYAGNGKPVHLQRIFLILVIILPI